jgi:hypothetical protein
MFSTTYSTLSNKTYVQSNNKPIKQGWVLKKSRLKFFPVWKPKYAVLTTRDASLTLLIFDQCDQSKPPRYTIPLKDVPIQMCELKTPSGFFSRKSLAVFQIQSAKTVIQFTFKI